MSESNVDIAIVGMECVFPGARNIQEYWHNLVTGYDAISDVPPGRMNAKKIPTSECGARARGGFLPADIEFDPLPYGIMPSIVPHGDPDQFLMLQIIDKALHDANVAADSSVRERTDVIIGRGGYSTNQMSELYVHSDFSEHLLRRLRQRFPQLSAEDIEGFAREVMAGPPCDEVDRVSTCIPNLVASRAANRLNLRGVAYTVDAACASSIVAVEQAISRLRQGRCDLAVAGGIHLLQTPSFWAIFTQLGAISPSQTIRPFDRRADGLLIGEGAGAVILRRLPDALAAENEIYAVIKGVGMSSDGRSTTLLTPNRQGQIDSLRQAFEQTGIAPDTIGYLEAHGTGTTVGDETELETIRAFFGHGDGFPPRLAMGSVKSMIGHTMPAAGIASLIKTALMLSQNVLVPSLHCEQPHPALEKTPFYVNRETRPWIQPTEIPRRAGINAFGFGGVNAHCILEEYVPDAKHTACLRPYISERPRKSELVVISADSRERLVEELEDLTVRAQEIPDPDSCTRLAHEASLRINAKHSHKLAVVCRDQRHLADLLGLVRERFSRDERVDNLEDVYFSSSAGEPIGKVAGIFPGVGFPGLIGNYPDHLLQLCELFPFVRAEFDRVDGRDANPEDPIPTSLAFLPPSAWPEKTRLAQRARLGAMKVIEAEEHQDTEVLPSQRNIAASCVTISNWVSWVVLRELKVPFDMLCGQSQGELAAMCASGMLQIEAVIPRFWQALALSVAYAGKGRLASVVGGAERIAVHIQKYPSVEIAIHVAPTLSILGGTDDELIELCRSLNSDGIMAHMLPYPPIHTPRLSHMREEMMQVVDMNLEFKAPQIPVYSAITEKPFPEDPAAVRELALDNLDRSVRFWQTMHRLYDDGARVFVQVGGGSLSSNIKSILPRPDIVGTAVDVEHRDPLTQLQHLCAVLLMAGLELDLEVLYRYSRASYGSWFKSSPRKNRSMQMPLRMDWVPFSTAQAESPSFVPDEEDAQTSVHDAAEAPAATEAEASTLATSQLDQPSEPLPFPFIDAVEEYEPGQSIVTTCELDLDRHLHLHDHVLIDEGSGKLLENRMCVLPMAMALEVLAESAAQLFPHLRLCGFERVSANRWIDFSDIRHIQLQVRAGLNSVDEAGVHRIAAEIHCDGSVRATAVVLLAETYQHDVETNFGEWRNAREWPLLASQGYDEKHMFHGPRFQCVSRLDLLADEGFIAELTILPTDDLFSFASEPELLVHPVTIDGILQLLGLWAIVSGEYVLPAKISKLEILQPTPPAGETVSVRAEITNLNVDKRNFTANVEVVDQNGYAWIRLQSVEEWLFHYSPELQNTQRLPTQYHISTRYVVPGMGEHLVTYLSKEALRHINLEWLARLYLHQDEWLHFQGLKMLRRQWEWLMGRIAAKDAVRIYLAELMNTELLHPARVLIETDEHGKPTVAPMPDVPDVGVSISHCKGYAMAIAGGVPCGVDIELTSRDTRDLTDYYTKNGELDLLDSLVKEQEDENWPLRFWCAKEAVAKAIGSGLQGRPKDFVLSAAHWNGQVSVLHRSSEVPIAVDTFRDEPLIIAIARPNTL